MGSSGLGRRVASGLALPTLLLLGLIVLFAWLLPRPGYYANKLVVAAAAASLMTLVWQRSRRTNLMLARFMAALAHGDLTQGFRTRGHGAGLDELAAALDAALGRLRAERRAAAAENRFATALVDQVPTPLLTVAADGTVRLANGAARHLFRESDGRQVAAFARYGGRFATLLGSMEPGGREVCHLLWNGLPRRTLVAASTIDGADGRARVVTVSLIHEELEQAELATQADLVRVLTHEIMNSLTPVTSLAASAAQLLDALDPRDAEALADARTAVATLARRAAAITGFVERYRDFGRTPAIAVRRFEARAWADDLARTFRTGPQAARVTLAVRVVPDALRIEGDPELLGQVVLNLLKNAGEAASPHASAPAVTLAVEQADAGRVRIAVADNGPGFPAGIVNDAFLPFYTTKPNGSGVGLSFARQVVLLHGGTIQAAPAGGAGGEVLIML